MSRRLYFTLPDVPLTRTVVEELTAAGVPKSHMHAIAGHLVDLSDLPEASVLQKSDFVHGVEAGIGVGGVAGLLGGLLAVTFPPAGLALGGAAIVAGTLVGAGFGAVVSALVSHDIPNHELEAFEKDITQGHVLLLVDVPKERLDEFRQLIISHHPEAEIGVTSAPDKA